MNHRARKWLRVICFPLLLIGLAIWFTILTLLILVPIGLWIYGGRPLSWELEDWYLGKS